MHGRWGHAWQVGACMAGGGHAWWGCVAGGMHGRWGACMVRGMCATYTTRYSWSMHGQYASYWNAFLFCLIFVATQ